MQPESCRKPEQDKPAQGACRVPERGREGVKSLAREVLEKVGIVLEVLSRRARDLEARDVHRQQFINNSSVFKLFNIKQNKDI